MRAIVSFTRLSNEGGPCRLASAVVCGLMEVVEPPILSETATAQRKEASVAEPSNSISVARPRPTQEDFAACKHLQEAFGLALTVLEKSSDSGALNAGAALSLSDVRSTSARPFDSLYTVCVGAVLRTF